MPPIPMDSPTEQLSATQESMFDAPVVSPALQAYEPAEDPAYEASQEFFEESSASFAGDAFEDEALLSEAELNIAVETVPEAEAALEVKSSEPVEVSPPVATAVSEPEAAVEDFGVLTADDFAALEERVLRAVSLVRNERQARVAAEERAAALEAQLEAEDPVVERLQQEVDSLRAEREQVRQRVERLLSQLDALEL